MFIGVEALWDRNAGQSDPLGRKVGIPLIDKVHHHVDGTRVLRQLEPHSAPDDEKRICR